MIEILPPVQETLDAIQSGNKLLSGLSRQLSEVEKEINATYHVLEMQGLDAVALVRLAKNLQKSLRERRQLKENISILQSVCTTVTQKTQEALKQSGKRQKKYSEESKNSYKQFINKGKTNVSVSV